MEKADTTRNTYANSELVEQSVHYIETEHYELALELLEFCLSKELSRDFTNEQKLMCRINKAQTLKWADKQDEMEAFIASVDMSGCGKEFDMALDILKDDFSNAAKRLSSIYDSSDLINQHSFVEPLYKYFIQSKEFKKEYKKIYKTDFADYEHEKPLLTKLTTST